MRRASSSSTNSFLDMQFNEADIVRSPSSSSDGGGSENDENAAPNVGNVDLGRAKRTGKSFLPAAPLAETPKNVMQSRRASGHLSGQRRSFIPQLTPGPSASRGLTPLSVRSPLVAAISSGASPAARTPQLRNFGKNSEERLSHYVRNSPFSKNSQGRLHSTPVSQAQKDQYRARWEKLAKWKIEREQEIERRAPTLRSTCGEVKTASAPSSARSTGSAKENAERVDMAAGKLLGKGGMRMNPTLKAFIPFVAEDMKTNLEKQENAAALVAEETVNSLVDEVVKVGEEKVTRAREAVKKCAECTVSDAIHVALERTSAKQQERSDTPSSIEGVFSLPLDGEQGRHPGQSPVLKREELKRLPKLGKLPVLESTITVDESDIVRPKAVTKKSHSASVAPAPPMEQEIAQQALHVGNIYLPSPESGFAWAQEKTSDAEKTSSDANIEEAVEEEEEEEGCSTKQRPLLGLVNVLMLLVLLTAIMYQGHMQELSYSNVVSMDLFLVKCMRGYQAFFANDMSKNTYFAPEAFNSESKGEPEPYRIDLAIQVERASPPKEDIALEDETRESEVDSMMEAEPAVPQASELLHTPEQEEGWLKLPSFYPSVEASEEEDAVAVHESIQTTVLDIEDEYEEEVLENANVVPKVSDQQPTHEQDEGWLKIPSFFPRSEVVQPPPADGDDVAVHESNHPSVLDIEDEHEEKNLDQDLQDENAFVESKQEEHVHVKETAVQDLPTQVEQDDKVLEPLYDDNADVEAATEPVVSIFNQVVQGTLFLAALLGSAAIFFRPTLQFERYAWASPKKMLDHIVMPRVVLMLEALERGLIRLTGPTEEGFGEQIADDEEEIFFQENYDQEQEHQEESYVDQQEELFENNSPIIDRRSNRLSITTPRFDTGNSPITTRSTRRSARLASRSRGAPTPLEDNNAEGTYRAVEFLPVRGTPYVQMRHVRRSRRHTLDSTLSAGTPMNFPARYLQRSGSFRSSGSTPPSE